LISYHASWVVPISAAPIRDGQVNVERGRVRDVGAGGTAGAGVRGGARLAGRVIEQDLGNVILMPGLVNAHTHLELSHLRGVVAPASNFVAWVRQLLAARRGYPDPRDPVILGGAADAIEEAVRTGTAVVGDISNTLITFDLLARSRLSAVLFYELIGFNLENADAMVQGAVEELRALPPMETVRPALAAHAPYSVARHLFRAIREATEHDGLGPRSVHLAESPEETQFIRAAAGPWRMLLEELGAWEPSWRAPGVSPVEYLDDVGFLGGALVVHGVQMSADDLARVAARGATLVTCPRSNAYTGAGTPPIDRFYASGVRVAVGTDSLTSTPDLNMFSELAVMRAMAPTVPASRLLDSATRQGAAALGFEADYGSIESGKRGRLLAVAPGIHFAEAADVEEYLLSGIQPDQISWIERLDA
jgi:aminodeoxyfutalosine deaminase